jgi:uncharacterized membrane protein (TIGR02234 family)
MPVLRRPVSRREFTAVLLAGAAGAGLILLAARQAWAHAVFTPPRPLPAQDFAVTGQALVPLASALALAALACLAAVIATRSVVRRAVGVLLAILGAGAAVAVAGGVSAASVLATARASASSGALGGSTTGGTSSAGAAHAIVIAGSAGRAVASGAPWRAVAILGAVAVVAAGVATVWRGPRWPVMSARFERPGPRQPGRKPASDSASMWESMSRDIDPTAEAPAEASDEAPAEASDEAPAEAGAGAGQLDGGSRA